MIFQFDETIPTNIFPDNPNQYELDISQGLVYRVEIVFPPGSFGLTGIRVFDGGYQLWPSNRNKWFRGDNVKIEFDDLYLKDEPPSVFLIECCNKDDTYEHVVFVRVGITSKKAFQARFLPTVAYDYYKQMLQDIHKEQEQERERQRQETLETILG